MKLINYKQRDINRVIKVYDAIGLILESAKKNEIELKELQGYIEKYPFNSSLEEIRTNIVKQLNILMIKEPAEKEQIGWHAHGNIFEGNKKDNNRWQPELDYQELISPYKYHVPTDKVHAKYSILKFIWWIYEQFLLASIHDSTAELFMMCGFNVTDKEIEAIYEWYKTIAITYGLPSQIEKTTRIKSRSQWSLEARKRHSKLMTKKNKERAKRQ